MYHEIGILIRLEEKILALEQEKRELVTDNFYLRQKLVTIQDSIKKGIIKRRGK